jgi:uncharacterized protein YndB with AHSA1/START domain
VASIRKELAINAPAEHVWAAIRDVGAVHTRLAQQFVVDTRLEGDSRVVTFANGEVVRERIVDMYDRARRLAYAVIEWRTTHHNASFQVVPDSDRRCRIVWITDLLPDTLAELVEGFMEWGGGDQTDGRNGRGLRFERELFRRGAEFHGGAQWQQPPLNEEQHDSRVLDPARLAERRFPE